MKKFICLLCCCLMCVSLFAFAGCKEKRTQTLQGYYSDYLSIAELSDNLTKTTMPARFNASPDTEIVGFEYSYELQQKISTIPAYSNITLFYNQMLDDAMSGIYLYGTNISTIKLKSSDSKYLQEKLNALKDDYKEISLRLSDLEKTHKTSVANSSLTKLFSSYENAIMTAIDISSKIYSIYYNQILINPNPDYSKVAPSTVNLSEIAIKSLNRLNYYKLVYLNVYMHTQILNLNVPTSIINGTFSGRYEPYDVLKNKLYSTQISQNIENYRNEIITLANILHNIHNVFEQEYNNYKTIIEKIDYHNIDQSNAKQVGYKQIVNGFAFENGIAFQSYKALEKLLSICY